MLETLLTAILVVALGWLLVVGVVWLNRPTRDQAAVYLRLLPDLTRLVLRLVRNPGTPTRYRVALIALGAWLAFPIDLIPDFLPVIGALDDIVLAALVLRWVGRGIGIERIEAAWSGSPEGLAILRRVLDSRSG
ncbi:MAG: DUF1232 domain-containing protein [Chloroflexota bacterium]|nr:DUF1232 domain-containing protein [Chloroflexota bacterium]